MKKIFLSLAIILGFASLSIGVTRAVFSSQAVKGVNTFSTGSLEIRLNGQSTLTGFTVSNAVPGECTTGQFGVNNYGAPWFAGPSTLAAKRLMISSAKTSGDDSLYQALTVKIEANRGWPDRMPVFEGLLKDLTNDDLLGPRWSDLAAGNSEDVFYEVCLPDTADDGLQGKSAEFNFVVNAYNP